MKAKLDVIAVCLEGDWRRDAALTRSRDGCATYLRRSTGQRFEPCPTFCLKACA